MSKLAQEVLKWLREVYGQIRILEEFQVGEGLRLDFYLPELKLGIEVQGSQHYEFIEFYHGDKEGFDDSKKRDRRKIELCSMQGIAIVYFKYDDKLSKEFILRASSEALSSFEKMNSIVKEDLKQLEYRKIRLEKARQIRKDRYKKWKERL